MGGQENVKQLEERSVSKKWEPNFVYPQFSVAFALLGIPLAKKMHSSVPILAFATGGALIDVAVQIGEIKEREQAKCAGAQEAQMGGQKNVKQLEERSVLEKLESDWVCSVSGAILSMPLASHTQSFVPIFGFAIAGAMLDVGLAIKRREDAKRERKLHDPK